MFKWLLIALLAIIVLLLGTLVWQCVRSGPSPRGTVIYSQEMADSPNVTVIVHQSAVNNMLQAIFPIEGEGRLLRKPVSISYDWRVENPHVEMASEGPIFSANATVHILGQTYKAAAVGKTGIRYDSLEQILYMELHELQVHSDAKVLGIPLEKLNLAPSDIEVLLLRKLPLLTHFAVKKPKNVHEDVEFSIVSHKIRFEKKQAVVDFVVQFNELSQGIQDTTRRAQPK
jgi:uncharacterized protein YpmS